jgi:hypothetical protein
MPAVKFGQLYVIPVLGRFGLTHGLLAWARAQIWAKEHGAKVVAPFWLKLRIGPYLRRERDKRNYFLLFHPGKAIHGLKRLFLIACARRINIYEQWPGHIRQARRPTLVAFHNQVKDNEKRSFQQVAGYGAFLREELIGITRSKYLPEKDDHPFIAVHVRLGDFTKSPVDLSPTGDSTNARLPIHWYIDRIEALQTRLPYRLPVTIFSDGTDEELELLLARPDTFRAKRQASVTDLLQMGNAIALVASGSGFSLWGAFLGDVPRISYPGQSIVPISADSSRDIESSYEDKIPDTFVLHVISKMNIAR